MSDAERKDHSLTEKAFSPEQQALLEELNGRIDAAYPSENWGLVSATSVVPDFRKQFYAALEEGQENDNRSAADALSARTIEEEGYVGIYTVAVKDSAKLTGGAKKVWDTHQPESLVLVADKLEALLADFDTRFASLPDFIRQEYKTKIEDERRNCEIGASIGRPEFTRFQASEGFWNEMIDPQKLQATGEIRLRYENDALAILQSNKKAKETGKPPQTQCASIQESMNYWQLSPEDIAQLGLSAEQLAGAQLPAEQIQKFFELLLARSPQLEGWVAQIEPSKTSIDVDGRARKISIPPARVFTPDDAVYIPSHEFIHIMGTANGERQDLGFLKTGMSDYLATEEGKAVLAEMAAGQKFGHERQVKMAARYYAVALALKTHDAPDGSPAARYSMQEIYNTLKDYQVSTADATEIVWRIMRGTSLQRQMSEIPVMGGTAAIPEVCAKDAVYFQGQMELFYAFLEKLPLSEAHRQQMERVHTRDFSNRLLARAGRAMLGESSWDVAEMSRRKAYDRLVGLGKEKLMELTQYFLMGKINLATLKQEPRWLEVIHTSSPDFAQYNDLFRPADQA